MKLKNPTLTASLKGLAALALAASVTLPARAATYQNSILDQGPLGYWRLTETTPPTPPNTTAANLGSVAGVDGTYAGDQSFFRGVPGAVAGNTGAAFDGVNQMVTTPYNAAMNTATFTLEGWYAPDTAAPVGGLTCATACGTFGSPRSGWLLYQSAANGDGTGNAPGWVFRLYNQNGLIPAISCIGATNMVPGTYYHVALTYDGTAARIYVNSVLVGISNNPTTYVPGASGGLYIGARSDAGFPWPGKADEVAFFGTALSQATIAAHYAAATTNAAGYAAQIGLASPLAYYRLGEAGDSTGAANIGSLGSAGNGAYLSTSSPGQPGPRPPTYGNLEGINYGCSFDGAGGFVALPALGTIGNNAAITAWVNPAAPQTANAGIFFNQGTASGLRMNSDGTQLGYDWNGTASGYASGLTLPASQWSFVAVIIQPTKAILCLHDGTTFSVKTNVISNASVTFSGKSRIGSFAATPTTFNGTIDEVTLFNRAYGVGEAYSQYAAAVGGLPPLIFQDPVAPAGTVYAFDTLNLAVDAGGTPDLSYQWRKDGGNVGANSSSFVIPSLVTGDSGTYDVVVANGFGSKTSAPVVLTVNALNAPSISVHPVGRTNYVGGLINLSVTASGGNLKYQWRKNGAFVAGATTSAYTVASAATNNNGTYTVSVTNTLGALTSSPASILVIQPASNSFEGLIVTDGPESWWRLDDLSGSTAVFDGMARHDGNVVGSVTYGATGITASGGNKAASFDGNAGNYLAIPYTPALNAVQYTVECWVNTPDLGVAFSPLSSLSVGSSTAPYHGKGYMILSETGGNWRTGTGQDDQYIYYYVDLGPVVANTWTHLVMTYSSTAGQVYYINGVRVPPSGGYGNFVRNVTEPLLIGSANPGGNLNLFFHGLIDEVAYYSKVLSQAQIQAHYQVGLFGNGTPPTFSVAPASQTIIVGSNVTFSATVGGTTPIGYQWLKNGSPIAGKTTNSLTLTNVYYTDAGNYALRATNTAGTNTSAPAVLSVVPSPSFVNATNGLVVHLKFDGDYQDSSGRANHANPEGSGGGAPSFVVGKIGPKAVHYVTHVDTPPHGTAVTDAGYVTIGNPGSVPTDLLLGSSQNFSVAYWVRLPNGYVDGDLPFLCSAPNSYGNFGVTFAPSYNAGGWSWFLGNSASGVGLYGPAASINNGAWHSLVHTFDRTANGITYLDGVLVSSILDLTAGDIDSTLDWNIGQDGSGLYPEAGSADVDDVGIWRRVLTPYEAQSIAIVGNNFGRSFDTFGPVTIKLNKLPGGDLEIIWQAGTLKQADSITGPWTPVPGPTAPYLRITPATTGAKFYGVGP